MAPACQLLKSLWNQLGGQSLDLGRTTLCLRIFELGGNLGMRPEDFVKAVRAKVLLYLLSRSWINKCRMNRSWILVTAVAKHNCVVGTG